MAKGQASAIGAIFLVIIIALSLSYVVWAISQIRDLNEKLVRVVSLREERRRENIELVKSNYVEYSNVSYSNIEGNLTSTCIKIGGETSTFTEIIKPPSDDFESNPQSTGWSSTTQDGICWPRIRCVDIKDYWGAGIDGKSIGFTVDARYPFGYVAEKEAWGYWEYSFSFSPEEGLTAIWLNLDYQVSTTGFRGLLLKKAIWTIRLKLRVPNGTEYIIASGRVEHVEPQVTSGRFNKVSLTAYMKDVGTYTIKIYASIRLYYFREYEGIILFDNLNILAEITTLSGGIPLCRAVATSKFNLPPKPLSTSIIVAGELNESASIYILYYDSAASTWRLADYLMPEGGEPFTVTLDVDPEKLYDDGEASLMFIMEGSKPFELTLNTLLIECGFLSDELNITVMNTYSLPIRVVSIWVMNSTHVWRFDRTAVLRPGESETFKLPVRMSLNSVYTVRVVTERGNIFNITIKT